MVSQESLNKVTEMALSLARGQEVFYRVTIEDDMFGQMKGNFKATSPEAAMAAAKDFYAMANDTTEEAIKIVHVELLGYK